MAQPGKGRVRVGVTLPIDWAHKLTERGRPIRLSQAAFVEAIVGKWVEAGCPAVTEADRAMLHLRALEKTLPKAAGKSDAVNREAS
jgi:hypothetical protein